MSFHPFAEDAMNSRLVCSHDKVFKVKFIYEGNVSWMKDDASQARAQDALKYMFKTEFECGKVRTEHLIFEPEPVKEWLVGKRGKFYVRRKKFEAFPTIYSITISTVDSVKKGKKPMSSKKKQSPKTRLRREYPKTAPVEKTLSLIDNKNEASSKRKMSYSSFGGDDDILGDNDANGERWLLKGPGRIVFESESKVRRRLKGKNSDLEQERKILVKPTIQEKSPDSNLRSLRSNKPVSPLQRGVAKSRAALLRINRETPSLQLEATKSSGSESNSPVALRTKPLAKSVPAKRTRSALSQKKRVNVGLSSKPASINKTASPSPTSKKSISDAVKSPKSPSRVTKTRSPALSARKNRSQNTSSPVRKPPQKPPSSAKKQSQKISSQASSKNLRKASGSRGPSPRRTQLRNISSSPVGKASAKAKQVSPPPTPSRTSQNTSSSPARKVSPKAKKGSPSPEPSQRKRRSKNSSSPTHKASPETKQASPSNVPLSRKARTQNITSSPARKVSTKVRSTSPAPVVKQSQRKASSQSKSSPVRNRAALVKNGSPKSPPSRVNIRSKGMSASPKKVRASKRSPEATKQTRFTQSPSPSRQREVGEQKGGKRKSPESRMARSVPPKKAKTINLGRRASAPRSMFLDAISDETSTRIPRLAGQLKRISPQGSPKTPKGEQNSKEIPDKQESSSSATIARLQNFFKGTLPSTNLRKHFGFK
eukprot:Nk52_evm12s164 gene=Nk52_evmTU12s164